ncbi:MAG: hypothetical protein R6U04_08560 [Bacteroidales bacterium]
MNRNIIIFTAIFIFIAVKALPQDNNINQKDDQGRKHGTWVKKYPNGKKMYEGDFEHGKPVGEFKRYHNNGELQAIMHHSSEQKVFTELYNKEGKKTAEGLYINKKKDSIWSFYDPRGNLISKEEYDNGLRNGESVKFYPEGDTAQIMPYKKGKKNGPFTDYFRNGNIQMQGRYINDTLDGELTLYHSNGNKKIEGKYEQNFKEGDWIYYEEDGDTSQILNYTNGTPENKDSLDRIDTQKIIELERKEGKFDDPKDMFYKEQNKRR